MRWMALVLSVLLGGCAAAFPASVMETVNTRVTADDLRHDPAGHQGERVIVGGEILATQPRPGETEIELLARRLLRDDSPERGDRTPGRFLLRSPEFLDPAVYAPGRRITVVGSLTGSEERKVGEILYRYPIITMERIRLWPKDVPDYPLGFWSAWPYGPYYDPYFFGPRSRIYPYGWWW
jgi:outer membrane lipoprotein